MAELTIHDYQLEFLEGCIAELTQELEEVYALATAGEVLLSDDKGPAFHLFMTIQRVTGNRRLIHGMEDYLKQLAST